MKQQFNVNLPGELVRRMKHHSIDAQLSLSDLVAAVFTEYLERLSVMSEAPKLVLQPMVHVKDMKGMVALLEALGGQVGPGSRDGDWVQVAIGGAEIGLLAHPANPEQGEGDVELNFEARAPLEEIEKAARASGVTVASPTTDEGFGRQLQLRSPDGLLVKINEIEPELIR